MFFKSIRLGKIAGISINLHSTFSLLVGFIVLSHLFGARGWAGAVGELIFTAVLFTVVVLHELGHALAARIFGIGTRDITLYPIGGVARLEYMPEKPSQEIVIALAGPAVNVALAALAHFALPFSGGGLGTMLLQRFIVVNLSLGAFNLLPAFPMDGGRVFRALMAFKNGYLAATTAAARVGKVIAAFFALSALMGKQLTALTGIPLFSYFDSPMLLLIAFFIWSSGSSEERMVRARYAQRTSPWEGIFGSTPKQDPPGSWPGQKEGSGVRVPHYTIED
jgi:Zn-dependent protease